MLRNDRDQLSHVTPQAPIRMTPEEERVFKDCSKDAFTQMGLPYGTASAVGTYIFLKLANVKSNAKFGYLPLTLTAGMVGSFAGLVLYKALCIQKVIDLPNSSLKQQIEAAKKQMEHKGVAPTIDIPDQLDVQNQFPKTSDLQMDDYQPSNDFDNYNSFISDRDRDTFYMEPLDKFGGNWTTYDDLRRKNREEAAGMPSRTPPGQNNQRYYQRPLPAASAETPLPFEQDRAPQYNLND